MLYQCDRAAQSDDLYGADKGCYLCCNAYRWYYYMGRPQRGAGLQLESPPACCIPYDHTLPATAIAFSSG